MKEFSQLESQLQIPTTGNCLSSGRSSRTVLWLAGMTLAWMLIECGLSLYSALAAHSLVILAFASDSLVEILSTTVVLFQFLPSFTLSRRRANRLAGLLLFTLSGLVALAAISGLVFGFRPQISRLGMGVTAVALLIMPVLAWLKRREAMRSNNPALAADAVQSATCAYLAGITLAGLGVNAIWHTSWFDSLAALAAVPLLVKEGQAALQGEGCNCC